MDKKLIIRIIQTMETLYTWTKDELRLQGIHYDSEEQDICILVIHGMSGNIIENYFADVLGKKASDAGLACVYGHNRGYNHINDISKKDGTTIRIGVTYERFEECLYDIEAWISKVKEIGYKRIILLGHSLGCNKIIYFLDKKRIEGIVGIVFASPPDVVGLFESPEYNPNHDKLLKEAKENVQQGNPRKLVSEMIWDWYSLSSQTYLDLSERNGAIDNLPLLQNPKEFPELAQINVPILTIMGEKDDIIIRSLKEDLELIQKKAVNCPLFDSQIIKGGTHTYNSCENSFAQVVLTWVNGL